MDKIEFKYDEEGKFFAEIHKNGKVRFVREREKLNLLMSVCNQLGYKVDVLGEKTFYRGSQRILKQYEKKIKHIRNLQVLGLIRQKMVLKKKDPFIGQKIVSFTLAGVMAFTGIGLLRQQKDKEDTSSRHESYATLHENPNDPSLLPDEDFDQIIEGSEALLESPEDSNINSKGLEDSSVVGDDPEPFKRKRMEAELAAQNDRGSSLESTESETFSSNPSNDDPQAVKSQEIQSMLQVADEFHYSYHEENTPDYLEKAMRYDDIFEKYGKQFGIDMRLLRAIAAQEGYGDHERSIGTGPAEGIMQIEKSVWLGETVSAYNFETGEVENVLITLDKLQDLDQCIKIGAMIFQVNLNNNSYNSPLSLQSYNLGPGNINKMLNTCSQLEGVSVDSLCSPTNNEWLRYRAFLNTGDPNYVEHVCRFIPEGSLITVLDREGNPHSVQFINDYQKTK